jgi:hypothetical protein
MSRMKPIDEALFAQMWQAGEKPQVISNAVGISRPQLQVRAKSLGLPDRPKRQYVEKKPRVRIRAKTLPERSKPTADPKPAPEPTYHHGLSDAVKRAGGSVVRLGKVATSFRVPYREVLEMAGVRA